MKTSLQKHSFRTVGLALAIGLGLAASIHSTQAAIVQITLNRVFTTSSTSGNVNDVTGQSTTSTLYLYSFSDFSGYGVGMYAGMDTVSQAFYSYQSVPNQAFIESGYALFTFEDTRINNNQPTTGYAQAVGAYDNNTGYSITLTRVVFDNEDSSFPGSFSATTNYPDAFPSSTAVPEPGTFIPAAVLAAGALLRRRRSRSHRSGRATA